MLDKKREKAVVDVVMAIKTLARKHGVDITRTGVRRWDKSQKEMKALLQRKRRIEAELKQVKSKMRH